jgi:hypothetical protein
MLFTPDLYFCIMARSVRREGELRNRKIWRRSGSDILPDYGSGSGSGPGSGSFTCIYIYMYEYVYVYVYVVVNVYVYICITHILIHYICTYVHMSTYLYSHIYVYLYMHICTYRFWRPQMNTVSTGSGSGSATLSVRLDVLLLTSTYFGNFASWQGWLFCPSPIFL